MQGKLLLTLLTCLLTVFCTAQPPQKLKVFVDCSSTYCDMNYIKTEINFVDYVLDYKIADVHVLVTQQSNGGGGSQYQLIFFGGSHFRGKTDTLRYHTKPNSTGFETRDLLVKYLQLGLVPFLAQTAGIETMAIQLRQNKGADTAAQAAAAKDPWDYWVFNVNTNGNLNADQVYKSLYYNGNFTVSRVTDALKLRFGLSGGKNKTSYEFGDPSNGGTRIVVKNHNYNLFHQAVRTLNDHWSYGYDASVSRNTFNNYRLRTFVKPAIEYNVFPYKEVNNKLFTIRYGVDLAHHTYYDTTLYGKARETLPGHGLDLALTLNQKWGTVNLSSSAHSYFHNYRYYNIGLGGGVNVRVTGGLSFHVFMFGSYQRDQLYLPKGQATEQEVLTRQRQLATNYVYFTSFGVSYRFGSRLNNFVNPRFEGGGGNIFFF